MKKIYIFYDFLIDYPARHRKRQVEYRYYSKYLIAYLVDQCPQLLISKY